MAEDAPTAREIVNAPWSKLGTLPSTNWKVVTGTAVLLATMLHMFGLMAWAAHRDKDTLLAGLVDSWLLFVATAVLLVPAGQYVAKRMTYKAGGPDDQRAALNNAASAADVASATGTYAVPTPAASARSSVTAPLTTRPAPASDAPGQQVPGSGD